MAEKIFRPLSAKEIRKHIEGRSENSHQKSEKRKNFDDCDIKSDNKSNSLKKKYNDEDDRLDGRRYESQRRRRSTERHSDIRHRNDKRYGNERKDDLDRGRSSEHSRDRYSSRERERGTPTDNYHKKSGSKYSRKTETSLEEGRSGRRNQRSRHYGDDTDDEESSDRPAWATKAVMRKAEEIKKRKLIWSKPEEKHESEDITVSSPTGSRPSSTATWNSILAASSSDSKQLDKFKRLMGMKKSVGEGEEIAKVDENQVEAERRRQRELYSGLDQQYAVARSFTHLSRGQGLGFH